MKVKAIRPGRARVYDLTVEGDHNFIAGGQVVHNCLRDVSRVLQVPLPEVNAVTQSIIERSSGDERASQTIADSFKDFEVCREFNRKHPAVLHHSKRLEGLAKNLGIHAAGVVTSPVPLTDLLPLEIRKHEGEDVIVTALDMYGAAACGLVKLDVLGLRTLTVIKEALEAIEAEHGVHIDLESEDFDLNDPKVLQAFTAHDYGGVFQYDTPSADKVCSGVNFSSFEDIAAMTALNRPGTARSGLAAKYVERKKNPKLVEKVDFHPKVSEITADTLGIIVYQEHVIRIFTECAGFAPGTADSLRKTIAKKIGDETLGKERENFVKGCKEYSGIDEKTANSIMDAITFFGCLKVGTPILTRFGPRPIEQLQPGDALFSINSDGAVEENRVRAVGPSGEKPVFKIMTTHTVVEGASAGHWWMTMRRDASGRAHQGWKKTSELGPGDLIRYATNLNAIAGEKPELGDALQELRQDGAGEGALLSSLPTSVQSEAHGIGEPRVKRAQQDFEAREGLEVGSDQGRLPGNGSPSSGNLGEQEPVLGGRTGERLCTGQGAVACGAEGVLPVRGRTESGRPGAEPAHAARAPQGPGPGEQRDEESGSALPALPLVRARGGESSWSPVIEVIEVEGSALTYDIECEREPANYVLGNGLVSHNSYGFNKCLISSTCVTMAGAGKEVSPDVTLGELYEAQRSETPWGWKIRSGRLNILQMDDDGRVRPGRIKAIHEQGAKPVFTVKTASGREITGTANHRLLTVEGYRRIDQIATGTELVAMGASDRLGKKKGRQTDRAKGKSYAGRAGGLGTPEGEANPSYIDGRDRLRKQARAEVFARAAGCCEECGRESDGGKHSLEFAHVRSLVDLDGDYKRYHSADNAWALCNGCHKRFDYAKGERKKRWSKGRPVEVDAVVSVEPAGTEMTYDVEMDTDGHNFLANGIVSHNSHATEYALIAYWGMWLKVYYPLEFYWALLKNEPDRVRIAQLAKDAKKHDIKLLPPHVNTSKKAFAIDRKNNAIRGSLVDIKGVGPAAADTIMRNQPFEDWWDFVGRIDRKKVHKGVVLALAKAGALSGVVPSAKWFVENMEEFWKEQAKKRGRAREMLLQAEGEEDWGEEDAALISSQVNPLAFGKHPIDAYREFLEREVKVDIADMSSETFFKDHGDQGTFIAGVVLEVKYNQVGDFHTGELPTEAERAKMHWGARYANVNIEDKGGKQNRTKFDWDIFDEFRPLIDSGVGTPVIAHVVPNQKFENLKAQFAVDIGLLRKRLVDGEDLTVWEKIVLGRHPAALYPWKDEATRKKRVSNDSFKKSTVGGVFTGVVTNVKTKFDRNDNQMAFFGLLGADGTFIDVIAFSSVWRYARAAIKTGRLIRVTVEKKPDRLRGWSYFCGDRVKAMRKAP